MQIRQRYLWSIRRAISVLIWLRLLKLASLEFSEGIFKVGKRPFALSDLCLCLSEDVLVVCSMSKRLGCLQNLSLCLYVFVHILDLLVDL